MASKEAIFALARFNLGRNDQCRAAAELSSRNAALRAGPAELKPRRSSLRLSDVI
jgi:hypothetical protein